MPRRGRVLPFPRPRTGPKCASVLEREPISLITLDLNLGKENGLDLAREIRKERNVPIIMLTGKGDAIDRVVGLEVGADDYLAKPFELRELVARVRAVLRRVHPVEPAAPQGQRYAFEGWIFDINRRSLKRGRRRRPGAHHQRVQPAGGVCETAASRVVARRHHGPAERP